MRFFSAFVASLLVSSAHAFPSGAGGCPPGLPAVAGVHLQRQTTTGGLADGSYEMYIDGDLITPGTPFVFRSGSDHVLTLGGTAFRGFIFRLDGAGSGALEIPEGADNLQISSLCIGQGVSGVTHNDATLKGEVSATLRVDTDVSLTLDVTVVLVNNRVDSVYYYNQYQLVSSATAPTPAPVSTPTLPPVSNVVCGPAGDIAIAGSSTVEPVARLWAAAYSTACGNTVTVEGGGSSSGARRVCANSSRGESAVDIGDMSRQWKTTEATTTDGYTYNCVAGDTTRSAIQVDVAIDGLSVTTHLESSGAAPCIELLGGLTIDQLRWIFSSYTAAELEATGWDPLAVPNADGNDSTHLWSELNAACVAEEIQISGADDESGTYEYFAETIFADFDNGETFDSNRPNGYFNSAVDEDIVNYILANGNAIGYFGYAFFDGNRRILVAAPIENAAGQLIAPTANTINSGEYNPLARRIYMNLWTGALAKTSWLLTYGYSSAGARDVSQVGYVNLPEEEKVLMLSRAGASGGVDLTSFPCNGGTPIAIAGSSTVEPVASLWALIYNAACGTVITVEGGGSSSGARRVCDAGRNGLSAVDIGDMSRQWKTSESSTSDGFTYDCLIGDTTRSAIQVDVAIDGLSVVSKLGGSGGAACIERLGGLTIDQLRWIYSSYTAAELEATGWDPLSVPNTDGNDGTHLWSELNAACVESEILIAGPHDQSGTYEYFSETIFADIDNGEIIDANRPNGYFNSSIDEDLAAYLELNTDAIAYFGYAFFDANRDIFAAFPIQNEEGQLIAPTAETVGSGDYNPLSRRIYMNVLTTSTSYVNPFMTMGFDSVGTQLVTAVGYVPVPRADRFLMLSRLNAEGGVRPRLRGIACGSVNEPITIAGSSTVFPVADLWGKIYNAACGTMVSVSGGGSSSGARRVCGDTSRGEVPVDIGNMSRGWKTSEAIFNNANNNYVYRCQIGDTTQRVVQLDVAIDGLSVVTAIEGVALDCVTTLGGLTIDQLRWIYSSYTMAELMSTGWDAASLPNSDGDDSTHLWSELDSSCAAEEILISGADSESGTYEYFSETIFPDLDNGETFDLNRPRFFSYFNSEEDEDVEEYVENNDNAIGYFGYAYFDSNRDKLVAAAIQNDMGMFIEPSAESVGSGTYNPLARRIFMNVARGGSLQRSRAFLDMGLSRRGDTMVSAVGYVPLSVDERNAMRRRYAVSPCFSSENMVDVLGKGRVSMSELTIGDKVMAGNKYETVYSFGHRNTEMYTEFLQIFAGDVMAAELSEDHMLFVEGRAFPASAIKVGDQLDLVDGSAEVTKIVTVGREGAFAPFTDSGVINMNGVVASTYVNLQGQSDSFMVGTYKTLSMQFIAHATQAPHRVVCAVNFGFCEAERYNEDGISTWVAAELEASKWLFGQNGYVMGAAFGPILFLVGVAGLIEFLVKYPLTIVVAIMGAVKLMKSNK